MLVKWFGYLLALVVLLLLVVLAVVRYQPQWLVAMVNAVQSEVQVGAESIAVRYAPLELQVGSLDLAIPVQEAAQQNIALENVSMQANFSAWWTDEPFWLVEVERADVQLTASATTEENIEEETTAPAAESTPLDFLSYLTFIKVRVGELLVHQEGVDTPLLRLQLNADQELVDQQGQDIELTLRGEASGTTFELAGTLTRKSQSLGFDLQGGAILQAPLKEETQEESLEEMPVQTQAKLTLAGELAGGRTPYILLTGGDVEVLLDADKHLLQQLAGRISVTEVGDTVGLELQQLAGQYQAPGWDTPLDFALNLTGAAPQGAWQVDGTAELGQSSITLETLSSKLADSWHGKLNLTSQGLPPAISVLPYVEEDLFPFMLATEVRASAANLALTQLTFESPTNQFAGAASLTLDGPLRVTAELQADRLYLPLVPSTPTSTQASDASDAEIPAEIAGESPPQTENASTTSVVFTKEPLDWSWLQTSEAKVALTAAQLKLQDAVFTDFNVQLDSADGQLKLTPFAASIGNGGFSGVAELKLTDKAVATEQDVGAVTAMVSLQVDDVELESFGFVPQEELRGGALEVDLQLQTSGLSAHDLAAGLNGDVLVIVDEARLMNDVIELVGSDLLMETLNKLNPLRKEDPTTELQCGLVHFSVEQGLLSTSKQLVMETSKMEIVGDGSIDLNKEVLNITFSPIAKSGFGVNVGSLVKFLKLGGPLNDPKPTADAGGLLKSGAALGAAISTGGLSVVADGMASRALNAGSACAAIRKSRAAGANPAATEPAPPNPAPLIQPDSSTTVSTQG